MSHATIKFSDFGDVIVRQNPLNEAVLLKKGRKCLVVLWGVVIQIKLTTFIEIWGVKVNERVFRIAFGTKTLEKN